MNKIVVTGRLGKNPEIKETKGGTKVAEFSLAELGTDNDQTVWHNIVCFGERANVVEKYLEKGRKILVYGSLKYDIWTDVDGKYHNRAKIVSDYIEFLDNSKNDLTKVDKSYTMDHVGYDDFDNDIPF